MNPDRFEGNWRELKGKIKEKWGKLTDDDLMRIDGKYDRFLGALQKQYGYKKEQAEEEFNRWNWGNTKSSENFNAREPRNQMDRNKDKMNRNEGNARDENDQNKKRKAG